MIYKKTSIVLNLNITVRTKAVLIHLAASIVVAGLLAAFVFGLWYPAPYRELAGGTFLFVVIMAVNLFCGPVLTAITFDNKKSRTKLLADLVIIVCIQLAALAYGVYSVFVARPVAEIFEVDRMVVVTAAQIDTDTLDGAPEEFRQLPINGRIFLLSTRTSRSAAEEMQSALLSMQGIEPSARPDWWQPFADAQPAIRQAMLPIRALLERVSSSASRKIEASIEQTGLSADDVYYLPLVSFENKDAYIRLFDKDANIIGYAQADGFLVKR